MKHCRILILIGLLFAAGNLMSYTSQAIAEEGKYELKANESVEKANLRKLTCSPLYGPLWLLVWGSYFDPTHLSVKKV